jgi:hypothetical protein
VRPERDAKGRRICNAEELTKLRLLGRAATLSRPIYHAASLPIARLEQLVDEADNHATTQLYTKLIGDVLTPWVIIALKCATRT